MKSWKTLLAVIGAVVAIAVAVAVCVKYWDEITAFFAGVKEKCTKCCERKSFTSEEYSDFADI